MICVDDQGVRGEGMRGAHNGVVPLQYARISWSSNRSSIRRPNGEAQPPADEYSVVKRYGE